MPQPATRRGRDSKARIVSAAAELMYERGVRATTVDDILAASGAGKSQFYHYFPNKNALVIEVLSYQLERILEDQSQFSLDSWDGIVAWFRTLIDMHERRWGLHGCPLGSIAAEASEQGEIARLSTSAVFARWESVLAGALEAMRRRGELEATADSAALAEAVIAVMQGGYLLSSIKRDVRPMREALRATLGYLGLYTPSIEGGVGRIKDRLDRLT
jgi:TetR/AcrR family transcriptional repressor of nem operon